MGYILPVERYQYVEYQNRIPQQKLNVEAVDAPFKAVLEKKHEEVNSEYDRLNPNSYKSLPLKPQMSTVGHSIYAEITGKGREFSESV